MVTEQKQRPASPFDGALIIDKPAGMTSHDVVSRLRRILSTKKIGHTGTLDPFATGVLVMLVGKATRLARFLDKDEKSYEAVVRFGFETDTGDREGAAKQNTGDRSQETGGRIQESGDLPSQDELIERVNDVLPSFTGEIQQIPPMYSAKKVKGKKLYELARKGIEIEREPVTVNVSGLMVLKEVAPSPHSEKTVTEPNEIVLKVTCSAGTYIRALAGDIGKCVGIGCHLAELRRFNAGRFGLEDAKTLEELQQSTEAGDISRSIVSMAEIVGHLPAQKLDEEEIKRISTGLKITSFIDPDFVGEVRLVDAEGQLVAIGQTDLEGNIQPKAVFISD